MFSFAFLLNLFTLYIPLILFGYFMPNLIKRTLLFGVVIPEEVSRTKEVMMIQKIYKRNYGISAVLVTIIINIVSIKTQDVHLLPWGIIILLMIMGANYVYVHNKAKTLKEEKGWMIDKKQMVVVDTSHREHARYLSPHWFWIPMSIIMITLLFTMIQYSDLPEEIPTRFSYSGEVLGYSYKSLFTVLGLPFTQLGMTAMFYLIYRMIKRVKPNIQATRPKMSSKQNQIAKYYWAIYLLGTLMILNLHFAYLQLNVLQIINPSTTANMLINGVAVALPVIGVIFVAMKTGQSGNRIKVEDVEEADNQVIDRDDDRFWKWGLFYYNPNDPSFLVEKRFGIGWTINCAKPIGMAVIIATLILLAWALIRPLIAGGY